MQGKFLTMRYSIFLFLVLITCGCKTPVSSDNYFTPSNDPALSYTGRVSETDQGVELINSASSVQAQVYGDSITVHLKSLNDQHHYIAVEINENYVGRFKITEKPLQLALPKQKEANLVKIFKETEASNGSIILEGISAEKIEPAQTEKKAKIEFIGDSITCGMGADTKDIPCDTGEWYDQHNAYFSYGSRIARELNTDFELNCVSGMGMYRNWNTEDQPVMGDVYSNLRLDSNNSEKNRFNNTAPEIVSIALGTNDLSLGDGVNERQDFDPQQFTSKYIAFVENIFSRYPETKIALLSSPMIGEKENRQLMASLNNVKEHFKEKDISIFEFEKMSPNGCTSHPSVEDHKIMAQELIPFFKKLLKKT